LTDRRGTFAWYELLTTDAAAARDFYGRVLGWHAQDASTAFSYTVFLAGEAEISGLMELPPDARRMGATPRWVGYVVVDDIDAAAERLRRLGGTVLVPPTDSNIGRVSIVADPQTANFGMVSGLTRGEVAAKPMEPGHVGWRELLATDGKSAFAFYSELFGWQAATDGEKDMLESYQRVMVDGHMIGGMFTKLARVPVPFWLYYFGVADMAAAVERVKQAGGRVVHGPMELMDETWIAGCIDPQGAMFSLQGKTSRTDIAPASIDQLNWVADWRGFTSRGKVVTKLKR
jgi:predicted enzyme related to lactoylglutathione lyase